MRRMWRYIRLYSSFLRICAIREMEARGSFVVGSLLILLSSFFPLLFVGAIYSQVKSLGGWTFYEYLLLVGTFQIMTGIIFGLFAQNMFGMPDYVRKGELDFFLLKPVNSQFMLTTRYIRFNEMAAILLGVLLIAIGVANLQLEIEWWRWLLYPFFVACGTLICYAIWFIMVTPTVWIIRLETQELFIGIFDLGRYHPNMFNGLIKTILIYILPIGIVVATPSDLLLNRLGWQEAGWTLIVAAFLLFVSSRFWRFAQTRYYGASS